MLPGRVFNYDTTRNSIKLKDRLCVVKSLQLKRHVYLNTVCVIYQGFAFFITMFIRLTITREPRKP